MSLFTSLAALLALLSSQAASGQTGAPPTAVEVQSPSEVDARENGGDGSRSNPREQVVCETRPPTGSRLNQRRCRTRSVTSAQERLAQDALGQLRPGPSTDAILNSPTRPQ